ncbi:MAG: glycosyltransferase, partial [Elusimicrobia bacterium]|nr:glycosyltransferase [Elusimicrobiota bacterium]
LVLCVTDREKKITEDLCGVPAKTLPTGIRVPEKIRGFEGRRYAFFTGCMKNIQNTDAVKYFYRQIIPLIVEKIPNFKFFAVGSYPPDSLRQIESKYMEITGYVPDTTIYAASSILSLVPLRIGAGLKHKVVEALAYGAPVVATSVAVEGMDLAPEEEFLLADSPKEFLEQIQRLYSGGELWGKISHGGHRRANLSYSMEVMERKLAGIF